MNKNETVDISDRSTFQLKSTALAVIPITSKEVLRHTVQELQKAAESFVIIGAGSNSLFARRVAQTVLIMAIPGIRYERNEKNVTVTAGAGVIWDDLVLDTIHHSYAGLEALSAIPGTVGAAPIQNIGAYGTEVSEHITTVEVYDTTSHTFRLLAAAQCGFGYRTSNFKTMWAEKYIVVAVGFKLSTDKLSTQITYPGVVAALSLNEPITPRIVRDTITAIRWSKLPQPKLLPNVGSFFHNPIISTEQAERLLQTYPTMPVFPIDQTGMSKIAAGWLIEQCGWKGKRHGRVGMYEKNALVMVNYGNADHDDVLVLQTLIEDSVQEKFGITLVREPHLFF